jgi:D-inositol-3-phosphate glycosyltransferase
LLRIGVIMYQTSLTKGQELVAQRMVKEFRRQGHEAFLITSIFQDWEPVVEAEEVRKRGGYIHSFDSSLGIPVIRVISESAGWPPRRVSFVDFMATLTQIVDDLKLNTLITHSTLWNGPEEVVKFVEWRRNLAEAGSLHSRLVFCHMCHLQEPSDERYAIYERSFRKAWNETSLPQILNTADFILITTPEEGQFLKRLGAEEDRMMLYPAGVDTEGLDSVKTTQGFREKFGIPEGPKLVSVLGTVEERKNILAVLEVAKLLRTNNGVHFVVAGKLEGDYGTKLKEKSSSIKNVTVTGPISDPDKFRLIKSSYLNLTMSRSEALGISQLEFMAAGIPVITSGVGGQSWVVHDGVNGKVLDGPEDVVGAADAITALVGNPANKKKLGMEASKFASRLSTTRLVSRLAARMEVVMQEVSTAGFVGEGIPREEHVIEAWVNSGQRVVATSRRLLVGSAKGGKEAITIPYNEISKIVRHVKAPWPLLAIGGALSFALLASGVTSSAPIGSLLSSFASTLGAQWLGPALIMAFPLFPILFCIVIFALRVHEGYLVHYGHKTLFLPKKFKKAVKLADGLTPQDLFSD